MEYKYSFCTTCMNRLPFLEKTVFTNLNLIKELGNAEMVLLNYSSSDGMDEFVHKYLRYYLENGSLTYISISEKEKFFHSHAKNIAHKNSNGKFLINLDVDNILTVKYINILHNFFNRSEDYLIRGSGKTGAYGRIAVKREHFFALGGYNENILKYGGEDTDFIERAEKYLGLRSLVLQPNDTLHLLHSDVLRSINLEDEDIKQSYHHNREVIDFYLQKDIQNPNDYEKIDWGKM